VSRVLPAESLRWVSFGHVEADESGAMNDWLALAPNATVAQSEIGCMVSLDDLADRPPRPLADGEHLDIGGHVLQWFDTPHVPHAWEAGCSTTRPPRRCCVATCSPGSASSIRPTDGDIVGPRSRRRTWRPGRCRCTRRAADDPPPGRTRRPDTLAPMHAPAFTGDCEQRCSTSPTTSTVASPTMLAWSRTGSMEPSSAPGSPNTQGRMVS
jgi:hypothetical protein